MSSYDVDMRRAAFRHFEAGELLAGSKRTDVAGYLFGIAAECALKQMMRNSGMRPLPISQRREDPYYAHFELLKTMLRDRASGRLATEIRRYAESSSFMQQWDVSMRYSDGKSIEPKLIERWRSDARDILGAMDS
jgi:hypothetical protein